MTKRLFDVVFSISLLVLCVPLFIIIMISIKATSTGPIFYLGERIGLNGIRFRILKFRTLVPDAELHGTTTAVDDPRVTRIGSFLRKYKLDELPQLINVIKGDMSLVGPRPEVEEHTSQYTDEEKLILSVPPGITDYSSLRFHNLAEILGPDNPHQVYVSKVRSQKNQLRLKYATNHCFAEDMKILFLTIRWFLSSILHGVKAKIWNIVT